MVSAVLEVKKRNKVFNVLIFFPSLIRPQASVSLREDGNF